MNTHHEINYIEFSVHDMEIAKQFYSKAFQWEFTDYAPTYCGIKKSSEGEIGGFSQTDQVTTGGPLIVLFSENLEKSLKLATEAGAEITKDIFEFPGGKRFEFKDPSGNQLAVWSEL